MADGEITRTQKAVDALAPKSLKDSALRAIKLFVFVFITAVPYQDIFGADPAILKTAGLAASTAVVGYIANTLLTWASSE